MVFLLHFQATTLLPVLSVGLVVPQPPLLPPHPGFPEPLPGAAGAISPPLPALAAAAAAKFSKELLSILILIGPFLIMMFSQQFQPITVSRGD